jgi:hypothetical protein
MRRTAARGSWAALLVLVALTASAAAASAATSVPAETRAPSRWSTPLGTGARYAHTWLSGVQVVAVPVRAATAPDGRAGTPARGTLRRAELSGAAPVRHVLALTLPAADLQGPLRAGALLALTPDLTAGGLGVRTASGRRLFAALRDYGAYIVGPSVGAAAGLRVDAALARSFAGTPVGADLAVLVGALDRVTNSGPGAIGGPGPRRVSGKGRAAAGSPPVTTAPSTVASPAAGPGTGPVASWARPAAGALSVTAPPATPTATSPAAPAAALWGVAGLAAALLTIGLRAGFRLVR